MIWPLRILAVLAIVGGVIGISEIFDREILIAHPKPPKPR